VRTDFADSLTFHKQKRRSNQPVARCTRARNKKRAICTNYKQRLDRVPLGRRLRKETTAEATHHPSMIIPMTFRESLWRVLTIRMQRMSTGNGEVYRKGFQRRKYENSRNTRFNRIERSRLKSNNVRSSIADKSVSSGVPVVLFLFKKISFLSFRSRERVLEDRLGEETIIWEFAQCDRALLFRAGARGNDSASFLSILLALHVPIFLQRARLLSRAYVRIRTHTCAHDARAVSAALLPLEHAFPSASASPSTPVENSDP